jgi:hypothetical protein
MFHGLMETHRGCIRRIDVAIEVRRGAVMGKGMDRIEKIDRDNVTLVAH